MKKHIIKCIENNFLGYLSIAFNALGWGYYGFIYHQNELDIKKIFLISSLGTVYFACREVGIIYLKIVNHSFPLVDGVFDDKKRGLAFVFVISTLYLLFAPSST